MMATEQELMNTQPRQIDNNGNVNDESEEDDDEEVQDRIRAFQSVALGQNRKPNLIEKDNDDDDDDEKEEESKSSSRDVIHRYDEYASFLTRSGRIMLLGKDPPLSEEELWKRRAVVKFLENEKVHTLEPLSEADKMASYMTSKNWEDIDLDLQLTRKRWYNHMAGQIPFDEENNTLRGLENALGINDDDRAMVMFLHSRAVFNEINRQKLDNEYPDWEKLRHVSENVSKQSLELAREMGEKDARGGQEPVRPFVPNERRINKNGDKKKKGGLFGFFKKS